MNKHEFQSTAKSFRAGRISLKDFSDLVFSNDEKQTDKQTEKQTEKLDEKQTKKQSQNQIQTPARSANVTGQKTDGAKRTAQPPLPKIPERPAKSHKGDFGRVLLIGGSMGMSGAISLAGLAALRAGSGLVKVAVPSEIQPIVAQFSPSYMTLGCLSENGKFHGGCLDSLETAAHWSDVVALGPGMDRGAAQKWLVPKLYQSVHPPIVVDADGLNALAETKTDLANHEGQRILTPHPGEFQRLIGAKITSRDELEQRAIELAKAAQVVIVLKGSRTLVTDGTQTFHNDTGNPGMATAGSGDVLTGVVTSLVGQGLSAYDAAVLGVHLHGMSGDWAAKTLGEAALISSDLIEYLPAAFMQYEG